MVKSEILHVGLFCPGPSCLKAEQCYRRDESLLVQFVLLTLIHWLGLCFILRYFQDIHIQMTKRIIFHFVFIFYFFNQPRDILCGAADEVLVVLKDDKMKV